MSIYSYGIFVEGGSRLQLYCSGEVSGHRHALWKSWNRSLDLLFFFPLWLYLLDVFLLPLSSFVCVRVCTRAPSVSFGSKHQKSNLLPSAVRFCRALQRLLCRDAERKRKIKQSPWIAAREQIAAGKREHGKVRT